MAATSAAIKERHVSIDSCSSLDSALCRSSCLLSWSRKEAVNDTEAEACAFAAVAAPDWRPPHLVLELSASPEGCLHIALQPALVHRCSRLGRAKHGHIGLELVQLGVKALGRGQGSDVSAADAAHRPSMALVFATNDHCHYLADATEVVREG
jgi:hypothetical protein